MLHRLATLIYRSPSFQEVRVERGLVRRAGCTRFFAVPRQLATAEQFLATMILGLGRRAQLLTARDAALGGG